MQFFYCLIKYDYILGTHWHLLTTCIFKIDSFLFGIFPIDKYTKEDFSNDLIEKVD